MTVGHLTVEVMAHHLAQTAVPVEAVAERLRLSRTKVKLFRRIHGLDQLRLDPDIGVVDLTAAPAERLLATLAEPERIRYLVYAHTMQEVSPSQVDIAAELRQRLGLTHATAFALTQHNCASGLTAIDVCGELLAADGDPGALALVVTGEKAYSPMAQLIENTTIMSDASAACLVSLSGSRGDEVLAYRAVTDGRYSDGIRLTPLLLQEFGAGYSRRLADIVLEATAAAGLALADVTMIIPHNVNLSSWKGAIELLGVDRARVFLDNIPRYGHCYCSDPFLNYCHLRDAGRLDAGAHYVLTAVGLGATYSAMVLRHGEVAAA